ncbi:MAG: PBECR2 nuclease fold domain-containing protein [Firmicutes bacterium]|nr:PBECR2 nuclease fold domain-containing protein [[Eubacterium] siraeum]MCM1487610.1 PBECR2 nuclease fold domain-containing protein [Bacillota bacterium]
MGNDLIEVGFYKKNFNVKLQIELPCLKICQSKGLKVHIQKRHPDCLQYLDYISDIIENPDYIGINPSEPNSIELIKRFDLDIQIAIKLNADNDYYYVASLYNISPSKIQNRLKNGRIKKF